MSDIAINPVTRRVQFTGNTGTGPYAFTFNILVDGDIAVFKGTTELTLTTDYTVSINANGTGSITLAVALIASDVLTIIGGRELSRTTDFVTAGDLLASSLNEQLDSNVIMTQQLDEKLGRGLFVNPGDVFTDLELPLKDDRKGTVLGFNATTGDPEPGPEIADVDSLANISADIKTLAEIQDGTVATDAITNVNTIRANVTTVSGISGNVTTVAGISSDVTTVAADGTDIGIVAGSISNVNNVGGSISNVNTVSGSISNVNTVSGDIADVNTVAGISSDVSTVSGISADVTTVAADGTDIGVVAGISSDVTTVSGISANVTTVAGINAAVSTVAADQADIGVVSTNIASVNTVSTNIASINTNTANITDIQNASANAATATTQAGIATTQAGIATTKASEASASEIAAEAAKVAAEAALDEFTDIYLGAKASDPTTDNDGNALTAGDQYFNTTLNVLKIYNGSAWQAAAIDSSGFVETTGDTMTGPLDVQSTITSDGLTVDDTSAYSSYVNGGTINLSGLDASSVNRNFAKVKGLSVGNNTGALSVETLVAGSSLERMRVDYNGDISFYEDTGTTPKLVWKSADERLGIGTSSPARTLHLNGSDSDTVQLHITNATTGSTSNDGFSIALGSDESGILNMREANPIRFFTSDTERMRIDSDGNVGIGVVPESWYTGGSMRALQIGGNTGVMSLFGTRAIFANNYYLKSGTGADTYINTDEATQYYQEAGTHVWKYAPSGTADTTISWSEAMRIDSSGNLLVGTTDDSPYNNNAGSTADNGIVLSEAGWLAASRYQGTVAFFNRTDNDGDIAVFRKDGLNVGSIGSANSGVNLFIAGTTTGLKITNDNTVSPASTTGSNSDADTDLGASANRFKDLYLSGTIEIENGTGNVGVGKNALRINTASNNTAVGYQAAYSISTSANNTIMGYQAGYSQATGSGANALFGIYAGNGATSTYNTMIGPYAGYLITSGDKNTILGGYSGNQGGLDIRTSSNNIVLSDGDGNPRVWCNSEGRAIFGSPLQSLGSGFVNISHSTAGNNALVIRTSSTTYTTASIVFQNSSAVNAGYIQITGANSVAYATSSDHRLKENVVELTGATDRLKQLNPSRFNFIADADTTVDGFLAHEVQSVVPEAITGTHNEVDDDGNPVYQGIDQSKLVPLLVATIKELEARITALENA